MEHPLTTLIRWYVVSLLAVAVAFVWPEYGLVLLATNCFGWWPADGCCSSVDCGSVCSPAATASVQIDISGVTNLNCANCTTYWNKSFVLPQNTASDPNGCRYDATAYSGNPCGGPGECGSGGVTFRWTAVPTATIFIEETGTGQGNWTSTTSISNPRDCTSASGLSGLTGTEGTNSTCCEYSGTVATVTPL